ncbi:MAG: hypothetical protein EHM87_06775 [Burkholderiales bacterium]|nr:MAG: hypothetical protein EHM87_06775 [Burkholderiales bacterium]
MTFHPIRLVKGPLLATALLAAFAGPVGAAASAGQPMLDLGAPSVHSQQGQRLKLLMPFGSAPGEPVSVTRFEVVSVQAPAGFAAPDAAGFTISKPPSRNLVLLQSREPIEAPELTVTVRVADQPEGMQTWKIGVPPALASMAPAQTGATPLASGAERPVRRGPTRRARAPR